MQYAVLLAVCGCYAGLCVVAMQGCYEQLEVWIKQHSTIMITLGFRIATVQVRDTCVHDDCDDKSCHIFIFLRTISD